LFGNIINRSWKPLIRMNFLFATLVLFATVTGVFGAPCEMEDFETKISGESECLLMRRYGSATPTTMIIWLHGNITSGGPANSHFRIAEKEAAEFAAENVLVLALVRPGYPDGTGVSSSGNDYGRADNWPRDTIAEIGSAIERLRFKYKPSTVIIVGHSGGAAITAVLMGMKPQLADAMILVACPCDLVAWRAGRRGKPWVSEDPLQWVDKVNPTVKVIAMTGIWDDTTIPGLSKTYVERLKTRGIDAIFQLVPDSGHIDVLGSPAVSDAISILLHR
jgi:poly(3-hydroxybutyrate) depolymerase